MDSLEKQAFYVKSKIQIIHNIFLLIKDVYNFITRKVTKKKKKWNHPTLSFWVKDTKKSDGRVSHWM